MIKCLFLLAALTATTWAFAQKSVLLLQKRNNNKSVVYKIGDEISFYTNIHHGKVRGEIVAFEDSVIVFNGYRVDVRNIKALHIDEKTRWWLRFKLGQILLIGGLGYFIIDSVNNGEVSQETLVISSVAVGAGLLAKLLITNKIKIKGRTKLRIVHL